MTRIFGVLLRFRHLNAAGVDFHVTLDLHLDGGANWKLHFRPMLQQRPRYATRDSSKASITGAVEASSGRSADAAHRSSHRRAFGRILDSLAGVLVLLDCPFRVLHAFVIG